MTTVQAGTQPPWWTAPGTNIFQSGAPANNYAPVNNGQLKQVAKQAKAYLDGNLPGGSGSQITAMVAAFKLQTDAGYTTAEAAQIKRDNYAPVLVSWW